MFEGICEALHRELDSLDEKYSKGSAQLTMQDLEVMDKAAHTLKSIAGYEQMKGSSEYGSYYSGYEGSGTSYARGRNRMTGRYMSRDVREVEPGRESEMMYRR